METVRPVEIPVITTVKQCLAKGNYPEAVRYGYQAVIYDIQRATQSVFPPNWTNTDVLERAFQGKRGYMPQLIRQLYALYEPVRFGNPARLNGHSGDVVGILQSLYADESLWRLYSHRVGGASSPENEEGALGTEQEFRIRGSHLYVKSTDVAIPPGLGQVRLDQSRLYVQRKSTGEARNP